MHKNILYTTLKFVCSTLSKVLTFSDDPPYESRCVEPDNLWRCLGGEAVWQSVGVTALGGQKGVEVGIGLDQEAAPLEERYS